MKHNVYFRSQTGKVRVYTLGIWLYSPHSQPFSSLFLCNLLYMHNIEVMMCHMDMEICLQSAEKKKKTQTNKVVKKKIVVL